MPDSEPRRLDSLDREILRQLQADGRLSNVDLAARIRLSPSPCLRRVRALEDDGYIRGYAAQLNPERVGAGLRVFVNVTLTSQRKEVLARFEEAVAQLDRVLECHLMAGDDDYLLVVAAADLADYQRFFSASLGDLPGVTALRSMIPMKTVKSTAALPV